MVFGSLRWNIHKTHISFLRRVLHNRKVFPQQLKELAKRSGKLSFSPSSTKGERKGGNEIINFTRNRIYLTSWMCKIHKSNKSEEHLFVSSGMLCSGECCGAEDNYQKGQPTEKASWVGKQFSVENLFFHVSTQTNFPFPPCRKFILIKSCLNLWLRKLRQRPMDL